MRRSVRLGAACTVAIVAAGLSVLWATKFPGLPSDTDHLWHATRAALRGDDPYVVVGPGRAVDLPWPLYYPAPALVLWAPLALLPLVAARALFVGLSAGALAYGATHDGLDRLPLFASGSFFMALTAAQLSPLFTAAFFCPALAWIAVVKPNLGAAVTLSDISGRALTAASLGGALLLGITLVMEPEWPRAWLANVRGAPHFLAPVRHWGGPLLLLSLLRWRRAEARLLLAMACVPHTTLVYEALPLFAIPRRRIEALSLAVLSWGALALQGALNPGVPLGPGGSLAHDPRYAAYVHDVGDATLSLLYLPCLFLVLRRPNEGPVPAWMDLATAWVRTRMRRAAARAA